MRSDGYVRNMDRRPLPQRATVTGPATIMFRPARWLFGAVWVARRWRAVWLAVHVVLIAIGLGLIALAQWLPRDGLSASLAFIGVVLAAWGLLRLPSAFRTYRYRPPRPSATTVDRGRASATRGTDITRPSHSHPRSRDLPP